VIPVSPRELLGFLRRAECVVDVGDVEAHAEGIAVEGDVPRAYDDHQARMEVSLYPRSGRQCIPAPASSCSNQPNQGSTPALFAPISTRALPRRRGAGRPEDEDGGPLAGSSTPRFHTDR
jgi:hypothetical protein